MISAEDFLKENPVRLAQTGDPADSITESVDSRSDRFQAESAGASAPADSVALLAPAPEQKDDSFKEDSRLVQSPVLGLGHGARFGGSLEDADSAANADMGDESLAGRHSRGHRSARVPIEEPAAVAVVHVPAALVEVPRLQLREQMPMMRMLAGRLL